MRTQLTTGRCSAQRQAGLLVTAIAVSATCCLTVAGCTGRPKRVNPARLDADGIAARAIAAFDDDSSGDLDDEELSGVKSLARSKAALDTDKDGKISASEIASRLGAWRQFGAGLASVRCAVVQGGRPVIGATVTYVPEDFIGDALQPGSGVTQAPDGRAVVSLAEEFLPGPRYRGLQSGFYRVHVTMPDGQDVTDLNEGFEVAGDLLNQHTVNLP